MVLRLAAVRDDVDKLQPAVDTAVTVLDDPLGLLAAGRA